MGESLSKMVAIMIAVFLLFIFPLINMFENQDDISNSDPLRSGIESCMYFTRKIYFSFNKKVN